MGGIKKWLLGALSVLTLCAVSVGASACGGDGQSEENTQNSSNEQDGEKIPSEGLEYTLSDDGTYYSVTDIGSCTDTDVVISASYKDLPVTEIGEEAFESCKKLMSIMIPDSVTSIGEDAFAYCSSLTSVVIPDSVTSIGLNAFYDCSGLEGVYITDIAAWCNIAFGLRSDNPLYYAKNLYFNNELVTELVIPDSVTRITGYAFYNCESLTKVEVPDSVTSIGYYVFGGCTSLTYNVKDGLKYLGNKNNPYLYLADTVSTDITKATIHSTCKLIGSAFENCSSLTEIVIPDSVTSIGSSAFENCNSLIYNIKDGLEYLGNKNNPYLYLAGITSKYATTATINSACKLIATYAFANCTRLKEIIIPESVVSIGYGAFWFCENLTIYCEAESQPSGWTSGWNPNNRPVEWGYKETA